MRRFHPTQHPLQPANTLQERPDFLTRDMFAEIAPIDGSHWRLCLHPLHYRRQQNPDLLQLLANPGATNPFFDTTFVNAGRERITSGRIFQLVVWEGSGPQAKARICLPVAEHRAGLWQQTVLKSLTHPYAPLGTPLFQSVSTSEISPEPETISRFLELLRIAFENDLPPLMLEFLPTDDPLAMALENSTATDGLCVSVLPAGKRAAITQKRAEPLGHISKKRMREYRRLEKKLGQFGDISFHIATGQMEILVGLEEFLLMEARGWKGRQGTSIHNLKRHAAFARQAMVDFSAKKQAEIATLRINDTAIASILLISVNGCYFPWKITYNETFSRYSPGSILMLWLTREITSRDDFRFADSLAKLGPSWMTNLWPDTITLTSAVIAPDCDQANAITNGVSRISQLKLHIKRLIGRT